MTSRLAHPTPLRQALAVPRTQGWGIALAVGTAVISGLAVYLNATAVRTVPDPALFTTLKNGVAAAVIIAALAATVPLERIRAIPPRVGVGVLVVGAIGGSIPFVLFFSGLAAATAPSAAFIHKTMFVWVALLAVPLLGERLGWVQVSALAVLIIGQAFVLPPTGLGWGEGETMIAIATLIWAAEVIVAKRLLAVVPPLVLGAARMGVGLLVLVGYLLVSGRAGGLSAIGADGWAWVLVTGVLLAGYVTSWFAALRRAPASVVTAILVLGAVITGALQAVTTGNVPAAPAAVGYGLIGLAVVVAIGAAAVRRRSVPIPAT